MVYFFPDRENPNLIVESCKDVYIFILVKDKIEQKPGNIILKDEIHNLSKIIDYGEEYDWAVKKFQEFGRLNYPTEFREK